MSHPLAIDSFRLPAKKYTVPSHDPSVMGAGPNSDTQDKKKRAGTASLNHSLGEMMLSRGFRSLAEREIA